MRELHAVLGESGVFRTIGLYRADADGRVRGPGVPAPPTAVPSRS
ncbi:hypothetical protein ACFQ3Z_15650 [Streptomyces nogalater]